jgi:hypothetical protein
MEWPIWQPPLPLFARFDQVVCTAKLPVVSAMFAALPGPEVFQAQRSPFSCPLLSVQPPSGSLSVTV